jgi:hypothetical protein
VSDYEPRLRAALQRAADQAPTPAVFDRGLTRRVRMRLLARVSIAVTTVAVLVGGSVVAGTRLFSAPTPKPANQDESVGPWTRNLYVLDPANLGDRSFVRAFAETSVPRLLHGLTAGYYTAGYDPQMTLSPDGSRLYVVSSFTAAGIDSYRNVIDTYDTRTGKRLSRTTLPELDGTNKDRTLHKLPVFAPDFVSSLDGRRLYLGETTIRRGPVRRKTLLGTFDTATSELLPNSIEIPDCDVRVLLPGAADSLVVACSATGEARSVPATNFVYFLEVADDGSAASFERLDLSAADTLAWAVRSADGRTIYAVTRDAHVYGIDATTRRIVGETDLDLEADVRQESTELSPDGAKVQTQKVALSPDGSILYLGTALRGAPSVVDADGISAFDTRTWQRIQAVRTEDHFWTMTLGPGGDRIYAPSFDEPSWSIQVFDARTLEQLGTIEDVGRTPALIEVPRLGR